MLTDREGLKTRHYSRPGARRPASLLAAGLLACASLCLPWAPAFGQSAEHSERELAELRERIEALQRDQAERTRQRDRTAAALQEAERTLAEARRALAGTTLELAQATVEEAAADLRLQGALLEARESQELLAEQLRLTYYAGRQERLRLLLNQEDPARLGRMLVYYDYLNRHRSERLAELRGHLVVLEAVSAEARAARLRLDTVIARREAELAELESAQRQRQAALSQIEDALAETGGELQALARQEEELGELIERLRRELASLPAEPQTPFRELEGRLPWPLDGELLHGFGEARADGGAVRWNGLLLAAARGGEVRAVHAGRVAYADWLPGMGLLLVLDHGDGHLSLYGHNEALLREPGDWVSAGDVVAHVGDTGGQNRTGLYFEIRHQGRPVDPRRWLAEPQP